MERWQNRVAVVTGASSGIGAACCVDLVNKGMIVVGLARRENRLEELKAGLPADQQKRFYGFKCDISKEDDVVAVFARIDKELGGADVLVNNAGISRKTKIIEPGNGEDLRAILDTNVLGVSWCTREAFRSLQERKIDDGHVVIINSLLGHQVFNFPDGSFNMYPPSKYAITALTEVLRQEFLASGTKTKITSISPGLVDTEIINQEEKAHLKDFPFLRSEDIADAVSYCIQTPPTVQIHELTIRPVATRW